MSDFKLATSSEDQQRITIMSTQLKESELEKARVSEQLQEVIRMNTHWQRYDAQRAEYVMKLSRTNQDLQDKVSDLQHQLNGVHRHHNKHEHQGISSWQDNETKSKVSNQQTYNASPCGLTTLNNEEEIVTLTDHIAKLKIRICELENERVAVQKQSDEQTSLLREQINICVDDFKQERKDRERCHEENVRLQKQLAQAENDLKSREEQLHIRPEQIRQQQECRRCEQDYVPARRPFDEPRYYAQDRPQPRYQTHSRSRYAPAYHQDYDFTDLPRDVEIDGEPEGCDEVDGATKRPRDKVDGPSEPDRIDQASKYDLPDGGQHMPYEKHDKKTYEKQLPKDEGAINMIHTTEDLEENINGKEELLCPKCLKSFGVLKHLELLDHIYICTEYE